jgi:shikimate kinase
MLTPRNIFLVGPMGAGKSTVGRQLSKATRKRFIDSDKAIEERTGASISLIFDVEGELQWTRLFSPPAAERCSMKTIVRV